MIDRHEIEYKASEFEIHTSNVQRDYVFGWLLNGIFTQSNLREGLILKGGNALRKGYFRNTRFSSDLDFSTLEKISDTVLLEEFNQVCTYARELSGVEFINDMNQIREKNRASNVNHQDSSNYLIKLYFQDFYGHSDSINISVKMDVKLDDKIYLPIQKPLLIHPYSDSNAVTTQISCMKAEEIIATKIKCLLEREHIADLFDLVYAVFFNHELNLNRQEIVKTFLNKTFLEKTPHLVKGLLLGLPLEGLKRFWTEYIVCPKIAYIDFDEAISAFQDIAEQLFGHFVPNQVDVAFSGGYSSQSGYAHTSEFRRKIFNAGRNVKMLKITYDGISRLVEPYSLTFKQKSDGESNEYLYVFDTTGGKSGTKGIKSFIFGKIQQLEETDISFQPRYEIELVKSQSDVSGSYFSQPFSHSPKAGGSDRSSFSTSTRVGRQPKSFFKSPQLIYMIQCTACGKKFRRASYNTSIDKHKDKYGNQCYGRYGYLVEQKYE